MSENEMSMYKPKTGAAKIVIAEDRLPYLKLMIGASGLCKSGEFPINHYALKTGDVHEDLGKEVDALLLSLRATAMQFSDDGFIICHDQAHGEFDRIKSETNVKDSGASYGHEYLVWLPADRVFALFFCGSKTSRKLGLKMEKHLGEVITLTSQKIVTKKFEYFSNDFKYVEGAVVTNHPSKEDYEATVAKFDSEKGNVPELAIANKSGREV